LEGIRNGSLKMEDWYSPPPMRIKKAKSKDGLFLMILSSGVTTTAD
jgi:hypothetical protein